MEALKDRCEKVLISALKKTKLTDVKGPPQQRNRRDNTPEILLKCIKAADKGASEPVLKCCLKMFTNPEVPLKDLKSSPEISDYTKSKIFETRMDMAAQKINRYSNELDRQRHEKEQLKKQLKDKYLASQSRTAFGHGDKGVDKSIEQMTSRSIPSGHSHHLQSHRRYNERKQIQHMVNTLNTPRI